MRFFRRKVRKRYADARTRMLRGGYRVDVVGESHYQEALERIVGGKTEESVKVRVTAALVGEPSNPYDPNAVSVWVDDELVGYLPRPAAAALQPLVKQLSERGEVAMCNAVITGGWYRSDSDQGNFGIYLDIAAPDQAL